METSLRLIENIVDNIKNEQWSAVVSDIGLIDNPKGYLRRILKILNYSAEDGEYYPGNEESERWLKAITPMLVGEFACGNL